MSNSNGRVNILQPNTNALFKLYDKIACDCKATEYREPLKGNWENNKISITFFSRENIEYLQTQIIVGIKKVSNNKIIIGKQCVDTLKIIMRSTYLTYSKNNEENLENEIKYLNKKVLDYCIPQIYNDAQGYLKYLIDASTLVVPIDLPCKLDYKEQSLSEKFWF